MKKWICMLFSVAMLLSLAACGENETDQPKDDATIQQSDSASKNEGTQQSDPTSKDEQTQQSDPASEGEKEPAKAELKYETGYYAFEDLNEGFIDVRSLLFHDDGTVDYDWATYDYTTVGEYKLEYNGKPIYMVAGPSGDTFSYTVSDDKITVVDWSSQSTVFALTADGTLKIEQTASESFTEGKEYVTIG